MIIDPEKTARLIAEIAQEEIGRRFGKLKAGDISTKTGPQDFVTEADLAAERKLALALGDIYPGATFVGEEIAARDPALVGKLGANGAFWIVDPLDGTRNFVQGRAQFGSIIALVVNGVVRNGWIYAIPDDAMAIGACGDGVSWRGEQLGPPPLRRERDITGLRAIGSLAEPWKSRLVPHLRDRFETESVHCSAYGYIDLLCGERQFALYSRCWPWDHAAGVMMLREIGGRAEYLDNGEPYHPVATQGRPLLVAANADALWDELLDRLGGK